MQLQSSSNTGLPTMNNGQSMMLTTFVRDLATRFDLDIDADIVVKFYNLLHKRSTAYVEHLIDEGKYIVYVIRESDPDKPYYVRIQYQNG